ncbi:MAG: sec-independent protein translocase protein TatC, partial [Bacteroidota bacterium]|nr:sec-independent protein translocase protein TatC [Bacteroidota bacterium]
MAEEKENIEGAAAEPAEMGFWDHVEELRKRIILSVVAVVVGCISAGVFINQLIEFVLLKPAMSAKIELQNLKPFGQPFLYFKIIIIAGLIIAIPFILYQLWKFIAPGLYQKEKKWVRYITFFTSFCFFSGVAFSYFVMIPTMLAFAAS